jgi:hypothetical protein
MRADARLNPRMKKTSFFFRVITIIINFPRRNTTFGVWNIKRKYTWNS